MILVLKDGRVFAYHEDNQDILNKYPADYEIVKVNEIEYDEEGNPVYKGGGISLRSAGTLEQRIADLEAALAALIGGGV